MLSLQAEKPDFGPALAALKVSTKEKSRLLLQAIGIEVIAYLRSLTAELRSPASGRSNMRQAHPGHWADITGQLAGSYSWQVVDMGLGVALVLRNTAEYAIWLELREGFFVLRGVTEPGGPVQQAIDKVLPQIAPGWSWRLG